MADRYVPTRVLQQATRRREIEILQALRISWQDGGLGAGRMRMRETMLHIERLCRLPQLDLLRRRALNAGGR